MQQRKVLFVLTAHDRLGPASDEQADRTGFHLAEAAVPWAILTKAGFDVDLATPSGAPAPIDPSSHDLDDEANRAFLEDARMARQLANPHKVSMVNLASYEAIYFPGGHGTMWDFPEDTDIQHAVRVFFEADKIVGAVCHGPAALVDVRLSDGRYLVEGRRVSAFTDDEERAAEKDAVVPFLLASRLEERGATHEKSGNFEASVSVDDNLVTGQNPASARGVGEAMRDGITRRLDAAA